MALEQWVLDILAHPVTKLAASPHEIGMLPSGVVDARIHLRNTIGFQVWDSGQVAYERWEKRTAADYQAEIAMDAPVYERVKMSGAVLDVGGGHGAVREFLPKGTRFISIDPFADILNHVSPAKKAAYSCLSKPLNFIAACAEFLPFQSAAFDVVHMRSMLDHVHSPDLAILEARRVLKPGGRLVIGLTVDGGKTGRRSLKHIAKEALRFVLTSIGVTRFKDHHTFHPTFANLVKIVECNGFSVDDVFWQPGWDDQVCYLTCTPTRPAAVPAAA